MADYEYREYLAIKDKIAENGVWPGYNSHTTNKLAIFYYETKRNFLFFREEPRPESGSFLQISAPDTGIPIAILT